jgi:CRISPR-associated protein Cas2
MYIILVYDVAEKRVGRMLRFVRRYLPHIQNSVFEGELSESKLDALKVGLLKRMVPDEDAVIIWTARDDHWIDRETLGAEKRPVTNFL